MPQVLAPAPAPIGRRARRAAPQHPAAQTPILPGAPLPHAIRRASRNPAAGSPATPARARRRARPRGIFDDHPRRKRSNARCPYSTEPRRRTPETRRIGDAPKRPSHPRRRVGRARTLRGRSPRAGTEVQPAGHPRPRETPTKPTRPKSSTRHASIPAYAGARSSAMVRFTGRLQPARDRGAPQGIGRAGQTSCRIGDYCVFP